MEDPAIVPRIPDALTVASAAVIAYALSNVAHEGLGHGGACVLVGCSPHVLTSMQFDGDYAQLPDAAARLIAAGGSVANLVVAAVAIVLLRRFRTATATTWFFFWLLATVSLLQGTGYLLFSGVGNAGDWAAVVLGWPGGALWRVGLAAAGGLSYWAATRWAMSRLGARLHSRGPARVSEAYRYTLIAYVTGAVLYVLAGSRDPGGLAILLISGVAASLGGTSGLAWGPQLLKDPTLGPATNPLPPLPRDWRWVAAAALTGVFFVLVLGSGIRF
jgi:hypothetical protein